MEVKTFLFIYVHFLDSIVPDACSPLKSVRNRHPCTIGDVLNYVAEVREAFASEDEKYQRSLQIFRDFNAHR